MKHSHHILFTIIIFPMIAFSLQAQTSPTIEDVRKSFFNQVFVFADNVNIRSKPSLDSEVLATLKEGTPLVHITTLGITDTIDGRSGNWTKVAYNNRPAYVWSPLVTHKVVRSHQDPDVLFLVGPNPDKYLTTVKVMVKGEKVQELAFKGLKSYDGLEKWEITGNFGVELVDEFLHFHYYAYACGKIGGEVWLAWDGAELHPFFTDWGIGDAEFFEGTRLILPAHPLGEKGVIHVFETSGENIWTSEEDEDNIPEIRFDRHVHRQYLWDGKQLVEMRR